MLLSLLRRVGEALLSAVCGGVIVFALLVAAPGDPAARVLMARGVEDPHAEDVASVRAELGLDYPLPVRFVLWFTGLLRADLGVSWRTGSPVAEEFLERLPATGILTIAAVGISLIIALVLGIVAGWRLGSRGDVITRILSAIAMACPTYVIGVFLLDLVAVRFGWGRVISDGTWSTVFWPALTLALASAAIWSRVLRASLLELGTASFLTVATSRGSGPTRNMFVHRLPNALPPFLTVVGLGTAGLLAGAPIAETVFSWPGAGRYTVEAIQARDMPVVTAFTGVAVLAYVVMSLLVDVIIMLIDSRQRTSRSKGRSA